VACLKFSFVLTPAFYPAHLNAEKLAEGYLPVN